MRYFALSHPWGNPPHFCTYLSNVGQYQQNIAFEALPTTFRNAVTLTRELGLQYLWIDSICIIQGDNGDFEKEAILMETVFSNAYCVLAASAARGQDDGFLHNRRARKTIVLQRPQQPPLYVSEFLDDFKEHVLEGHLNQRGWVLQERALARRTIYFTATQTYWECGHGVRCETMTQMHKSVDSIHTSSPFNEPIHGTGH